MFSFFSKKSVDNKELKTLTDKVCSLEEKAELQAKQDKCSHLDVNHRKFWFGEVYYENTCVDCGKKIDTLRELEHLKQQYTKAKNNLNWHYKVLNYKKEIEE